jgi:hypothetical protein
MYVAMTAARLDSCGPTGLSTSHGVVKRRRKRELYSGIAMAMRRETGDGRCVLEYSIKQPRGFESGIATPICLPVNHCLEQNECKDGAAENR